MPERCEGTTNLERAVRRNLMHSPTIAFFKQKHSIQCNVYFSTIVLAPFTRMGGRRGGRDEDNMSAIEKCCRGRDEDWSTCFVKCSFTQCVWLSQIMTTVILRWAAPLTIILVLPLVTHSKVVPWTLDYPTVNLKDGRINVNITGTSAIKKFSFIMAVNKKVTYGKPPTKFKLECNTDLHCVGSGGPTIEFTDKVYYGMKATLKNKNSMKFKNKKFARLSNFQASTGVSFEISPPTTRK